MSNAPDSPWLVRRLASGLIPIFVAAVMVVATGCHQPTGAAAPTDEVTGALTAADRAHAVQARLYSERAARYRAAAVAQRLQAAAYARWSPRTGERVATNWNQQLATTHQLRAAAADQIAADLMVFADFHTAEANREAGR